MQCSCKNNKNESNVDLSLIEDVVDKYKDIQGSLITILQGVQEVYNYVPIEAVDYISDQTGIKPSKIYGVLTFYTQFRMAPVGKNLIMLCQGTACHVRGAKAILTEISKCLGLKGDEVTTKDLNFTLETVACIGCCGLAPVIMVNDDTHGRLVPDAIKGILEQYV